MPIKISIKNLDKSEDSVIVVKMKDEEGNPVSKVYAKDTELQPGEEIEKFVHPDQHIVVEPVKKDEPKT